MPVSEAADGMPLEASHVYVIPANVDLTVAHGALKLAPRTQAPGSHMPIDRFLRSAGRSVRQQGHRGDPLRHGFGRLGWCGGYQRRRRRDLWQDASSRSSPPCRKLPWPPVAWILCCRRRASPRELVRIGRHPYIADAVLSGSGPNAGRATMSNSAISWLFCTGQPASTFRCTGRR